MSHDAQPAALRCTVVGGEKLLAGAGGRDALCREIRSAVPAAGGTAAADVRVEVFRSHLQASVTLGDGRKLPDIGFAVSDAALSPEAIRKFAAHVGSKIIEASR